MGGDGFHGTATASDDKEMFKEHISGSSSFYNVGDTGISIYFKKVIVEDLPSDMSHLSDKDMYAEAYKRAPSKWECTAFAFKKPLDDRTFCYYWAGVLPC